MLRQQQQIQALIAQNEALHSHVRELETLPPVVSPALEPPTPETITAAPPPAPIATPIVAVPEPVTPHPATTPELALAPNADGVIDLAALLTASRDGEVNPFAIRRLPADAVREISLHVQGIVGGATPCALVNRRAVQPPDTIESLTVHRIETDAVVLRHGGHLLRLPVAEKPARVRLPL